MKTRVVLCLSFAWCVGVLIAGSTSLAVPADDPAIRLFNVLSRVVISAEAPTAIVGFVIDGETGPDASRWFLIRVVGPSLAELGVPRPLARPAAVLHGQSSGAMRLGYEHRVFAQIVYGDGTTPASRFREALRRAMTVSGAFPVPIPAVNEPLPDERDVVDLIELRPGAYSVHAFAREPGGVGDVLVESYVLPADFDPQLKP